MGVELEARSPLLRDGRFVQILGRRRVEIERWTVSDCKRPQDDYSQHKRKTHFTFWLVGKDLDEPILHRGASETRGPYDYYIQEKNSSLFHVLLQYFLNLLPT